jgi:murein DD-endopeptidase MepM/ murein hydrolase activator NlpD
VARTVTGTLTRTWVSATRPSPEIVAPVPTGTGVLRRFERPDHDWSAGHRGVDLATDVGAPVVSAIDGVVTFSGTVVDRGVVTVRDVHGMLSTVEPVTPVARTGETVQKGQAIATAMTGHCSSQPCLHWGIRVGGAYVDPLGLLRRPARIVLLPIPAGSGYR